MSHEELFPKIPLKQLKDSLSPSSLQEEDLPLQLPGQIDHLLKIFLPCRRGKGKLLLMIEAAPQQPETFQAEKNLFFTMVQ